MAVAVTVALILAVPDSGRSHCRGPATAMLGEENDAEGTRDKHDRDGEDGFGVFS